MDKRPSWDEYFLGIVEAVSKRATCDRGKSGCVIVRDRHILVTGYVGSPVGLPHCDEVGHLFRKVIHKDGRISEHCVRGLHAEQNAICQAALLGVSVKGGTLYCQMTPCIVCAMLIINSGIIKVVANKFYQESKESIEMFLEAGIKYTTITKEVQEYEEDNLEKATG